jgi:aryl-alcohol dehydrogenase-like predicted oxidoreductase
VFVRHCGGVQGGSVCAGEASSTGGWYEYPASRTGVRPGTEDDLAFPGGKLDKIAKHFGATVAQLSIAWLVHRSAVMLPTPGTSSVAHLEENTKAAHFELSEGEMKEIEKAVLHGSSN